MVASFGQVRCFLTRVDGPRPRPYPVPGFRYGRERNIFFFLLPPSHDVVVLSSPTAYYCVAVLLLHTLLQRRRRQRGRSRDILLMQTEPRSEEQVRGEGAPWFSILDIPHYIHHHRESEERDGSHC